jgi:hypothetical protein
MTARKRKKVVISETPRFNTPELVVRQDFEHKFKVNVYDFGSMRRLDQGGVWTFDVVRFDKYLETLVRGYDSGCSTLTLLNGMKIKCTTKEVLRHKWGPDGDRIIRYLILGNWDQEYGTHF